MNSMHKNINNCYLIISKLLQKFKHKKHIYLNLKITFIENRYLLQRVVEYRLIDSRLMTKIDENKII